MDEESEHRHEKDVSSCEPSIGSSKDERKSPVGEDGQVDLERNGVEELIQDIPTNNDPKEDNTDKGDMVPVHKPLKRPRTAYFIFQGEKRPQVKADYPSETIGSTARRIG